MITAIPPPPTLSEGRREDVAESINRDRRNPRYLSQFEIPERVEATCDLRDDLAWRELAIIAVPIHYLREVIRAGGPFIHPGAPTVPPGAERA